MIMMENNMMAGKSLGEQFLELYDQIPEAYRERYRISLVHCPEYTLESLYFIAINEAKISIIPRSDRAVWIAEAEDKLSIFIEGVGEIYMYKNYTLIAAVL